MKIKGYCIKCNTPVLESPDGPEICKYCLTPTFGTESETRLAMLRNDLRGTFRRKSPKDEAEANEIISGYLETYGSDGRESSSFRDEEIQTAKKAADAADAILLKRTELAASMMNAGAELLSGEESLEAWLKKRCEERVWPLIPQAIQRVMTLRILAETGQKVDLQKHYKEGPLPFGGPGWEPCLTNYIETGRWEP